MNNYKLRGKFNSPIWEFSKKTKGFQSYFVSKNDFGYEHEINLYQEIGTKLFNKIKSTYTGHDNDYVELEFTVGEDNKGYFVIMKSVKIKVIIANNADLTPKTYYTNSINKFGVCDGKPVHRYAYNYVNSERISKGEMPKTFQEFYETSPAIMGMTFKELADTKNLLNL